MSAYRLFLLLLFVGAPLVSQAGYFQDLSNYYAQGIMPSQNELIGSFDGRCYQPEWDQSRSIEIDSVAMELDRGPKFPMHTYVRFSPFTGDLDNYVEPRPSEGAQGSLRLRIKKYNQYLIVKVLEKNALAQMCYLWAKNGNKFSSESELSKTASDPVSAYDQLNAEFSAYTLPTAETDILGTFSGRCFHTDVPNFPMAFVFDASRVVELIPAPPVGGNGPLFDPTKPPPEPSFRSFVGARFVHVTRHRDDEGPAAYDRYEWARNRAAWIESKEVTLGTQGADAGVWIASGVSRADPLADFKYNLKIKRIGEYLIVKLSDRVTCYAFGHAQSDN